VRRLLIILVAAAASFGCSTAPLAPPAAPLVGGPCEYSYKETVFTAVGPASRSSAYVEFVFSGNQADIPVPVYGVEFVATFDSANRFAVTSGQQFRGNIAEESKGSCPGVVFTVEIDGKWFRLLPREKALVGPAGAEP
jgi:hypothetical protein